jgi:CP family cyanate transporter-like MFS transporter
MRATTSAAAAATRTRPSLVYALLWLCGVCLRLTVLATPPVVHLIRAEWNLSTTAVGFLVTLPTVLFAAVALPGAVLVGRFGPVRTLVAGLVVTAAGSALRGLASGFGMLAGATVLMAAGVAVMQPALPLLVRRWVPMRIGLGTAVFTNGVLVGETIPVALTAPLVLPAAGGLWRGSLAAWSLPVAAVAVLVAAFAPPVEGTGGAGAPAPGRPQWRSGLIWQLGLLFGCTNALYFASNAFLPGHLTRLGRPDLIAPALTALNAGQLPAAFLLLAVIGHLERRAAPFVALGAACLVALAGVVASTGAGVVVWSALLGFSGSAAFILTLALPPLLRPPEDVAPTSAAMFTISYGGALGTALLGGATADVSGHPTWAFAPVGACAVLLVAAALLLRRRGALR